MDTGTLVQVSFLALAQLAEQQHYISLPVRWLQLQYSFTAFPCQLCPSLPTHTEEHLLCR